MTRQMSKEAAASVGLNPPEKLRLAREILQLESRTLTEMACRLDGRFCEAVDILYHCHGSVIVSGMGKAGLVDSTRGPKGGFVLAKAPGKVTLLEVLEAVDGPVGMRDCLFARQACNGSNCLLGDTLKVANKTFRDYFRKTRLSAFAESNGREG